MDILIYIKPNDLFIKNLGLPPKSENSLSYHITLWRKDNVDLEFWEENFEDVFLTNYSSFEIKFKNYLNIFDGNKKVIELEKFEKDFYEFLIAFNLRLIMSGLISNSIYDFKGETLDSFTDLMLLFSWIDPIDKPDINITKRTTTTTFFKLSSYCYCSTPTLIISLYL